MNDVYEISVGTASLGYQSENNTYLEETGWKQDQAFLYTTPHDGYLEIEVKRIDNANNSEIPSECLMVTKSNNLISVFEPYGKVYYYSEESYKAAAVIIDNPYEWDTQNGEAWGKGVFDAYFCYYRTGHIISDCYDTKYSEMYDAYDKGYQAIVNLSQKYDLDQIYDFVYPVLLKGANESYNEGYSAGADKGYTQALNDSDAFLGFIPAVLGGVVANVMPILTYEVYGLSIMNVIGIIAVIGLAIIIVKFIVG